MLPILVLRATKCTVYQYLSDKLPRMGVRKKPTRGERHQMRVMWDWDTPGQEIKNDEGFLLC